MTVSDVLTHGRSLETDELQATGMEKTSAPASEVKRLTSRPPKTASTPNKRNTTWALWWHIYPHPGGRQSCPAYDKYCGHCGKANHFSRLCRSKNKNEARGDWTPQAENKRNQGRSHASLRVTSISWNTGQNSCRNLSVVMMATTYSLWTATSTHPTPRSKSRSAYQNDRGYRCQCQHIRQQELDRIKTAVPLKPTTTKIYPYGTDKPLPLLGEITIPADSKTKITIAKFYVANNGKAPQLSYKQPKNWD